VLWTRSGTVQDSLQAVEALSDNGLMTSVDLRAPVAVLLVSLLLLLFTAGGLPALALHAVFVCAAVIVAAVLLARLWRRVRT
jgi:hypothetical protein